MIKSPIYYTGNKYKLLPQILPLLPEKIETFVDLFGGSGTVLFNVNAKSYIYNEINPKVVDLFVLIQNNPLSQILGQIKSWGLDSVNKSAYLSARDDYNNNPNPIKLFSLICHSFSNQIRFNKKGHFNLPFGDRTITSQVINNLGMVTDFFDKNSVFIHNGSFIDAPIPQYSFLYCDPPYLNSCATYNEGDGWNITKEDIFRDFLVKYDGLWALSNELTNNTTLREWAEDNHYIVNGLNFNYKSCNYQKKSNKTEEVLITNYQK
jgi:DNA adenine methylase